MNLPALSISAKLYAIFALLATATVGLAGVAVLNSQRHVALTEEYEAAYAATMAVERANALIYAVVMETRGVYMSPDVASAKVYVDGLLRFNERLGEAVAAWRKVVRSDDMVQFESFAKRIDEFQGFRRELARRGTAESPASARLWGDNDANRNARKALNGDLEALGETYAKRSSRIHAELDRS
ncbi:MAG: methyl-accepting chemotaxis protein, partial [Alphaproteobacteria bacterium]|nr:methyl-accepting chemotaxis protein [Alphaproteobacteria bacterium]